MIRIVSIVIIIITTGVLNSFSQNKHTLTLNFEGMESDKGKLYVAVYNKKEHFLKKEIKGTVVEIKQKKATVILKDIVTGIYAVSAFHDENNNKKMDTKIFGIPKEAVGISNNAKGFMGPPKYRDAKFTVNKDTTLFIKMY